MSALAICTRTASIQNAQDVEKSTQLTGTRINDRNPAQSQKMSKYTKSSKGKICTVRIPGVCNHNTETTVFAHLNGGGMGAKHSDIHGCDACSACHAWLDGGYAIQGYSKHDRDHEHYRAMVETQQRMIREGVLIL